jgi:DNA-binding HxlR family transcriptional regulator
MGNSRKEIDTTDCPVEAALAVIGGRWKARILWELHLGVRRYGELRRAIDGVSGKVLIQQLRQLEDDGVVERHDLGGTPPRVEYSLTPLGESLGPVMDAMTAWGEQHRAQVREQA